MKNTELAVFGTFIILCTVIYFLVAHDINQAREVIEFIKEIEYDNEVHKNACETYERAEAPESYLISNRCK